MPSKTSTDSFGISADIVRTIHRKPDTLWPEGTIAFGQWTSADQIFVKIFTPPLDQLERLNSVSQQDNGMAHLADLGIAKLLSKNLACAGAVMKGDPFFDKIAEHAIAYGHNFQQQDSDDRTVES